MTKANNNWNTGALSSLINANLARSDWFLICLTTPLQLQELKSVEWDGKVIMNY